MAIYCDGDDQAREKAASLDAPTSPLVQTLR
jgi:hypothetical protein